MPAESRIFSALMYIAHLTQDLKHRGATTANEIISLTQCAVEHPMRHTEIWAIPSRCEEVGCYGMINFLTACGDQLNHAYFINLKGVGCGDIH